MTTFLEILKSILYGIVEGVTEWLPVSSTGHLILLEDYLPFRFSSDAVFTAEFWEMFQVVIQLGAILAVVILFWNKLWPFGCKKDAPARRRVLTLWGKVIVASIPAAFAGIVLDRLLEMLTSRDIDGWLYNSFVVAVALIVYGIAFLLIERTKKATDAARIERVEDISYPTALAIGAFQMLSLVPGTSRSGSTILGSMLLGLSRSAGAEFSFLMAIPVMVGASGIKVLGFLKYVLTSSTAVPAMAWVTLATGFAVAFLVSFIAIRFLMDFVKRHTFSAFGVYRIVLGALVLAFGLLR